MDTLDLMEITNTAIMDIDIDNPICSDGQSGGHVRRKAQQLAGDGQLVHGGRDQGAQNVSHDDFPGERASKLVA